MPFLEGKISLEFYTDSSQTEFPMENIPMLEKEFAASDVAGSQSLTIPIAASGSQTVNLNGLTVQSLYIYSNATDLQVNMNALGNIQFKALVPGYMPLAVSSLVLTNVSSTAPTTVTVMLFTA